jgi:hypothetical protein
MTTTQLKTAIAILTESQQFELKQIEYSVTRPTKEYPGNGTINIWSTAGSGAFHATELIPNFGSRVNSYVDYNHSENRVELRLF